MSPSRSPLEQQLRRQTIFFIIVGIIVLVTAGIATYAVTSSSSGQGACAYQKSIYPSSHRFRADVKEFMHQTYLRLLGNAVILRKIAREHPDKMARDGFNTLAIHDARAAARAKQAWLDIQLPGPPTCS